MYRRRLPVYNRRQRSSAALINIILIGVIVGLAFLLFDRWRLPSPAAPAPTTTPLPTAESLAVAAAPVTAAPTAEPQARLFVPTMGVTASVVDTYLNDQSWDVSQLGNNAGHLQGTAWFGAPGNIALAGHVELADGSPGIFAKIDQLTQGDPIVLTLGALEQRYAVTEVKKVAPDDLTPLYPTTSDQITLITCNSYDFLQNDYQERVVVVAERIS
jgi:sortase A